MSGPEVFGCSSMDMADSCLRRRRGGRRMRSGRAMRAGRTTGEGGKDGGEDSSSGLLRR
ncbi:hypothetical protein AZ78_2780 [Lysobacter capsici AZ78]|uniref:Uncharacterized protein n=1 Tax=Lysobacter capsici AZ78 TaxID=1444315 RepID=A0A108U9W7_9GAMM|nr:hypothetical protein AZ78_2780 [Lysobacter capsici AZ78]